MLCLKTASFIGRLVPHKNTSINGSPFRTDRLTSSILSCDQQIRSIRSFENVDLRTAPRTGSLLDQRFAISRLVWSNKQRNFNLIQRLSDISSSNPLNKKENKNLESEINDSIQQPANGKCPADEADSEKLSIFKRFKILWKKYWYVLIPVHLVTSAVWFGCFYYLAFSGVDVVGFLEHIGFGETIVNLMKKYPSGGYLVLAYALYKVATPARYFVTVSGTHYAIKYLSRMGYIKPVPTKDQMSQFFNEQKRRHKDKLLKLYRQKRIVRRSWFRNKNGR